VACDVGVDEPIELVLRTVGNEVVVQQELVQLDWQPTGEIEQQNDEDDLDCLFRGANVDGKHTIELSRDQTYLGSISHLLRWLWVVCGE